MWDVGSFLQVWNEDPALWTRWLCWERFWFCSGLMCGSVWVLYRRRESLQPQPWPWRATASAAWSTSCSSSTSSSSWVHLYSLDVQGRFCWVFWDQNIGVVMTRHQLPLSRKDGGLNQPSAVSLVSTTCSSLFKGVFTFSSLKNKRIRFLSWSGRFGSVWIQPNEFWSEPSDASNTLENRLTVSVCAHNTWFVTSVPCLYVALGSCKYLVKWTQI